MACSLLGMRDYINDEVCVAFDLEIDPPTPVHTSLPPILGFVILLCAQRGVVKVLFQELYLLEKSLLYRGRSLGSSLSDCERRI